MQHFILGSEMISDEGISFVLIGFSELKSLGIHSEDMRTITETGLNAFVHASSSSLQELVLGGFQLTYELARSIATGLSKLRSLSIPHCELNEETLMFVLEGLSDLESLDMACSAIIDIDLELIADACSDNRISKITSLNVSSNVDITDIGLASIGRLRSLQSLNIRPNICACSISNKGVLALMEGLADSLQVLDLSNADFFTDDGMLCLASRLRKLRTLDMSCCHFVTHAGFAALANGKLPELQSISMKSCSLTDEGLWSIATSNGLTKLQSLHVNDCRQITDKGVAAVIARRKLIIYK
jgi:F-box/leucine-rich repeat protein 2/20